MGEWLYSVKVKELIYIKKFINNLANKLYGLVFNLIKSEIGIMFFGSTKRITVGQFIYRSKKRLKVPVGTQLLGRIVGDIIIATALSVIDKNTIIKTQK